jgi:hypothetical protein
MNALDQVRKLFGYADMKAAGDPCNTPSLECRLKALDEALAGGELPRCAGGVPPAALQLTGAECKEVEGERCVVASFNLPVMASSAQDVTKYTLTPETVITVAQVDPTDNTRVILNVTWPRLPEGEYTLQVHDLLAADGSTLNPEHRSADFKVGQQQGKRK